MEETLQLVGGFRSAIQDLLVPELKIVQAEMRSVRETLDRHEKWLERIDQNFATLQNEMNERFTTMQRQIDVRFAALQKQMDDRFAEMQKQMDGRFAQVLDAIRGLQQEFAFMNQKLDYGERIHKLELRLARAPRPARPKHEVAAA